MPLIPPVAGARPWRRLLLLLALWGAALWPQPAHALCVVTCSCSVSTSALVFGPVNPLSAMAVDSTGGVTVQCSGLLGLLVPYRVELGAGGSGSMAARRMSSGAHSLPYNVYVDAARQQLWGDGTGGSMALEGSILLNALGWAAPQVWHAHGRVPGGQTTLTPGQYADTLAVTLTYY